MVYIHPEGIFATISHLATLILTNNKLRYIPYKYIAVSNHCSTLQLDYTLFCSIPYAAPRFQRLQYLHLENNQIYAIEHYDLIGLVQL